MKPYECEHCGARVFFENLLCLSCGGELGYVPEADRFRTRMAGAETNTNEANGIWRACAHRIDLSCNWLVSDDTPVVLPVLAPGVTAAHGDAEQDATRYSVNLDAPAAAASGQTSFQDMTQTAPQASVNVAPSGTLCRSCRYTAVAPPLSDTQFLQRWQNIEQAKRYLFYSLLSMQLPVPDRIENPEQGLSFEFLTDQPGKAVLTGHADGVITLNVAEADDVQREQRRVALHEPYRTLLGHLRHEIGHFYWSLLVEHGEHLAAFRQLFGDERADYAAALKTHYQADKASMEWQTQHVSRYASAHPWEDWAETWAHYMHISDALDTAQSWQVQFATPGVPAPQSVTRDDHAEAFREQIHAQWLPLCQYLNAACRSLGESDAYPYVLSPVVIDKLVLVHEVIRTASASSSTSASVQGASSVTTHHQAAQTAPGQRSPTECVPAH